MYLPFYIVYSMTAEADNLVAKLIGEDGSFLNPSAETGPGVHTSSTLPISSKNPIGTSSSNTLNSAGIGLNVIPMAVNQGGVHGMNTAAAPVNSSSPTDAPMKMETWLYRDPQGSVQGPFTSHEMAQWYAQGYFSGNLLLRRDCDKVFVTLSEIAKLYGRNPFSLHPTSPPPPPIGVSLCIEIVILYFIKDT